MDGTQRGPCWITIQIWKENLAGWILHEDKIPRPLPFSRQRAAEEIEELWAAVKNSCNFIDGKPIIQKKKISSYSSSRGSGLSIWRSHGSRKYGCVHPKRNFWELQQRRKKERESHSRINPNYGLPKRQPMGASQNTQQDEWEIFSDHHRVERVGWSSDSVGKHPRTTVGDHPRTRK